MKKASSELTEARVRKIVREEVSIVREEVSSLEKKFNEKLDTKFDAVITKLDAFIGEIRDSREEQTLMSGRISEHSDELEDHEERIEKLEQFPRPTRALA